MSALTSSDIEIAARAADQFTRLYYTVYDSDTRSDDIPNFYRSTSTVTWNGTGYQGSEGVKSMMERMPPTKHEVQSYDCHPIPGNQPPSLLITVSGTVTHGKGPIGNPASTPRGSLDGQPRVFSQTFMLVPDPTAPPAKPGEVAKYYVGADAMRFVG
ncbi:NTF2-like protein [Neolentinus lepideus HHB14362 ss-1]|uniref:NTF2-like protein n=1 Tax=Neolentinus lepideus HHB14362 ss-1 TaxID=1314782 RepID=A0A165U5V1_9AGAM|nr:NTF2-like protein [Neolentinus lepideus HHB14362 ss-1]